MCYICDIYFLICLFIDYYRGSVYFFMWIKYIFFVCVFCDGFV